MKKIVIILTLLTMSLTFTLGQTVNDSISAKKVFGGYQFSQGGKRLKVNQLVNAMKPNEQAYNKIKSAKSTYTLATIIGGAGGFMVGYTIGTAIGGGDPNWVMAEIGAGLIVVSIPITLSYNKKAKEAVDTFNDGFKTSSYWNKSELKMTLTGNDIGFTLRF